MTFLENLKFMKTMPSIIFQKPLQIQISGQINNQFNEEETQTSG